MPDQLTDRSSAVLRWLALLAVTALAAASLLACISSSEPLDTSSAIRTLLGTTTGNRFLPPSGTPPATKDPPADWGVDIGAADFAKTDSGLPSLKILIEVKAHDGAGMDIWVAKESGEPLIEWSGGQSQTYGGTICFQLTTQQDGQAIPLDPGAKYVLTLSFVDVATGNPIVSKSRPIGGVTPQLQGGAPQRGSKVFSEAYSCRRGG